jgi:hypothetical protein
MPPGQGWPFHFSLKSKTNSFFCVERARWEGLMDVGRLIHALIVLVVVVGLAISCFRKEQDDEPYDDLW